MTTEVGHILDKYELLERVGQGGMAVVYRGLDRSLQREVAVKVLHRHLADSQEARDRFEREARAVAKLHHENILEIFDFSGLSSPENYIVTEFIEGTTLKDFVADRDIRYPEIGAMITVQVCRALSHAHSLGILHRDVKPENIMIRTDGVVKLTDFGIAQMVELQRMTVTGQLLGSPAYMSPEHVEGNRLDFRTDVFSTGILLYQLVTGLLPFNGRNPHEVLKRIAECRYRDPRLLNPLVADRLRRIIDRALARDPDQRYPDVGLMLDDLDRYLAEAGLTDHRDELARFFAAPAPYEMALKPRLLSALTRRGRELLDDDRVAALELFNQVLTIDPDHPEVLAEIERLSRRRRGTRLVALFGGIAALGAAGFLARPLLHTDAPRAEPASAPAVSAGGAPATRADAAPLPAFVGPPARDGGPASPPDAGAGRANAAATERPDPAPRRDPEPAPRPRAEPDAAAATRSFALTIYPPNSQYRVGTGPWRRAVGGRATVEVEPGRVVVTGRNAGCCAETTEVIPASASGGGEIDLTLGYLPGHIVPACDESGVRVQVDGKPARLGRAAPIFFNNNTLGAREVEVVFLKEDASDIDKRTVRVKYNQKREVECDL